MSEMNAVENVQTVHYIINIANEYVFQNFPNNKLHYQ